jgi:hypothetical protein
MKSNVLGKRDLHRFQLDGMILGNRYIISALRFRVLDYRSGSEFKLP